jgi:ADP-heptose:LPS heptosyltransferase
MPAPLKILAIQFKAFGDAVLVIPALRAIRNRYPDCALHALVPEKIEPLLRYESALTRIWPMPKNSGRANFKQNWPIIRALRAEQFDRSVDFGGNDRGAIMSFLSGARERLGPVLDHGFVARRFCYNRRIVPAGVDLHETLRSLHILSPWGIVPPGLMEIEIQAEPALAASARQMLPENAVICHMGAGMQKKQWPVQHWAALQRLARAAQLRLAFTPGQNAQERALISELKKREPEIFVLPAMDIAGFLAVLKQARALVSSDTGPMHFAAALGVPLIAMFGPSSVARWGPVGQRCEVLIGPECQCQTDKIKSHVCLAANHCLAAITPEQVFARLQLMISNLQKS